MLVSVVDAFRGRYNRFVRGFPNLKIALERLGVDGRQLFMRTPDGNRVETSGQLLLNFDEIDAEITHFAPQAYPLHHFARAVEFKEVGKFQLTAEAVPRVAAGRWNGYRCLVQSHQHALLIESTGSYSGATAAGR